MTALGKFDTPVSKAVLATILALCLFAPVAWWLSGLWESNETETLVAQAQARIDESIVQFTDNFDRAVTHIRGFPAVIAADPAVVEDLAGPSPAPTGAALNTYLAFLAKSIDVDLAFVVSAQGLCIGASNFDQSDSLVGEKFADREYFLAAMKGQPGVQYAVGRRTNIPGIFFSAPIRRDGRIVGAAIVKIDIPTIERFVAAKDAFVTDSHGVVIISSAVDWLMRALPEGSVFAMSPHERQLAYKRDRLEPLPITRAEGQAYSVRIGQAATPAVLASRPLRGEGMEVRMFALLDTLAGLHDQRIKLFVILYLAGCAAVWGAVISTLFVQRARSHRRKLLEVLAEYSGAETAKPAIAQEAPKMPQIDFAVLDLLRDDLETETVVAILVKFMEDAESRVVESRAAVARDDGERIRREAHTIKGAAASLGLAAIRDACISVEAAARAAEGVAEAVETLADAVAVLPDLLAASSYALPKD